MAAAPDSVTEAICKYFFLICFDENQSFAASLKVLSELKAVNRLDVDHRGHWIQSMHRLKPRVKLLKSRPWTQKPEERGFALPIDLDFATWVSFTNMADADHVEAVLLSRVLGFSDQEISQGLGVTMGTVRYRVGHGLRQLGSYVDT